MLPTLANFVFKVQQRVQLDVKLVGWEVGPNQAQGRDHLPLCLVQSSLAELLAL